MITSLINGKVEQVPWFKTWYVNIFCFVFSKMKSLGMFLVAKHDICTYLVLNSVNKRYWDDSCCENEILAYMIANLINGKVEFVPWFKTWFVNIFGSVFGKMKVLKCLLSRKWDFGLYGYKFEKYEG